jgi:septal ring factor EnvC (AmiA/AmiB activator)
MEIDHNPVAPGDADVAWLQKELDEAHKTVRTLLRQLGKEQQRHAETSRAYNKTVANLMEISRQNTMLERELDMCKARAEGTTPVQIGGLTLELTADEVSAIRKAMARLHHPDVGGDPERMKAWNAALDPLES